MEDKDHREMIRKNPEDVVRLAFKDPFMGALIRMFQRDMERQSAVNSDK